jgi:epoxyqueuosine reductase
MIKSGFEQRLKAKAAELGFVACGICDADAAPQAGARLRAWLDEGCHGEMLWMEERASQRASPQGLWPEVRSVIALGLSYAPAADPMALAAEPTRGRISVYAQGRDYHDVVKSALKSLARWMVEAEGMGALKVFVDTAPVMEKPLAQAAGTRLAGQAHQRRQPQPRSWLFLGAIYVSIEALAPDAARRPDAAPAPPARPPARPTPSLRPTASTRAAASPT